MNLIGQFHPLFVHLPIGMLCLAIVFKLMSRTSRWHVLKEVLPLILLLSFLAALGTTITGYLLSLTDEYGPGLIQKHQWAGIGLTLLTGLMYWLVKKSLPNKAENFLWIILGVLVILTGHWGGNITHGEGYLSFQTSNKKASRSITDLDQALVYQDLIAPILQDKCYSCHSRKKQKGKLRLDHPDHISKGGKNGEVIFAGESEKSPIYHQLILPELDDLHMPPKGRPQLKEEEVELIRWWIDSGASFENALAEIDGHDSIRPTIESLVKISSEEKESLLPKKESAQASTQAIDSLRNMGIVVLPVGENSNFLSVNFLGKPIKLVHINPLEALKENIVWLKLGYTDCTNEHLSSIGKLQNLTVLHLNGTKISDKGMKEIGNLSQLKRLNLSNTNTSIEGLEKLKKLSQLQVIYVFDTKVIQKDLAQLKEILPQVRFDIGGYKNLLDKVDTMLVQSSGFSIQSQK